jgi:hypothetical protein
MNNTGSLNKRRESRRLRRNAARKSRERGVSAADSFSVLADFDNLYFSAMRSMKNVLWKDSVIHYEINIFKNVRRARESLLVGKDIRQGFITFSINERGKRREIRSVHIEERVIQKCLCDYILIPVFQRSLIYDNGASLKNKGAHFSIKRLIRHLTEFYRSSVSNKGYALTVDFSKYFDNINHEVLIAGIFDKIKDPDVRRYITDFITAFGDKSIGLGSQVSQIAAIYYPNKLDHHIKEIRRIRGYGRYMDDFYLIHEDKRYLRECLNDICEICDGLGITVNMKKTRIVKLSDGVRFLKGRYVLTETGKVLRMPCKETIRRERRKMKKHLKKVMNGEMHYWDALTAYLSWRGGYKKRFYSFGQLTRLDNLFIDLFKDYHGERFIIPPDTRSEFPYYKIPYIYETSHYYDKKVMPRPVWRDFSRANSVAEG